MESVKSRLSRIEEARKQSNLITVVYHSGERRIIPIDEALQTVLKPAENERGQVETVYAENPEKHGILIYLMQAICTEKLQKRQSEGG